MIRSYRPNEVGLYWLLVEGIRLWYPWVVEPFWKWGGTSARQNTRGLNWQLWWHNHQIMTSLAIPPYKGLNCTISDKITLLWKRIGEPLAIKKAVTGATPGQQRHSGSSRDLFWLQKKHPMLASLKWPFAFILVALWR